MECVIPGRNIKLFSKSIQCMAKVGEELFIEASERKLLLRTFNASRSAFLAFYLDERFFDAFFLDSSADRKYQVKLKPCSAVFKQYNNVENCTIRLDEHEQRLVFELMCKHGIKKVYKLAFEECESLQAVYSKENCLNRIVTFPKKLIDCINNFHTQLDEISLVVAKDSVKVKSHVEDAKSASKLMQTELSMDPSDFDEYDIRNETQVTFQLKEAKALLSFCESSGQPVTMLFERSGRPIVLSVKYFGVFEADFVLATLVDPAQNNNNGTGSTTSSQTSSTNSTPSTNESRKRNIHTPSPSIQSFGATPNSKRRSPSPSPRQEPPSPSSTGAPFDDDPTSTSVISSSSSPMSRSNPPSFQSITRTNADTNSEAMFGEYDDEDEVDASPQPPSKKQKFVDDAPNTGMDDNMDDDDEVPCSFEEK